MVRFKPSSTEILAKIGTFAVDDEVLGFLGGFHESIPAFSLRTYGLLVDLKNAGMDWQRYGLQETDVPAKVIEIADLLDRFDTDIDCIERYSGSRRDFYNWKPEALAYARRRMRPSSQPALRVSHAPSDQADQRQSAQ